MYTDHKAVMARAWIIFRQTYNYPSTPFRSIGRKCFAWALTEAWRQTREAARIAAIPADVKIARIEGLRRQRDMLKYADSYRWATAQAVKIEADITRLAA